MKGSFSLPKSFFLIGSLLLIASLVGVYQSFTIPLEIEGKVPVFKYEHKGDFGYQVYQKASYLFGDLPLETNEVKTPGEATSPKYPVDMIDRFDMVFTYSFVPDAPGAEVLSKQVEVIAVMLKGPEKAEVILVPGTVIMGDSPLSVNFSLDSDSLLTSSTVTVTATVYTAVESGSGPLFESFTQNFNIRHTGTLLEVDKALSSSQRLSFGSFSYEQTGSFDYSILLKSSSPFGAVTLTPPAPQPPPPPLALSAKIVGPGEPVIMGLFDHMDLTFTYQFEPDGPVSQLIEDVKISAVLENPGVWRKEFALAPAIEKSDSILIATLPLTADLLNYYTNVYRTIERESKTTSAHNLVIMADVHTAGQTPFGPIDEKFSQTLTMPLEGNSTLEWGETLESSKSGIIEGKQMVANPQRLAGLSVSLVRNLSSILAGVSFILLLSLVLRSLWGNKRLSPVEEEARRAKKKHKDVIVDVAELPKPETTERVIQLNSLDELIKTADSLFKPVLHQTDKDRHMYCVLDVSMRYEYTSELSKKDKPDQ